MILGAMQQGYLSYDEKFVDIFAKLFRQSDATVVFDDQSSGIFKPIYISKPEMSGFFHL